MNLSADSISNNAAFCLRGTRTLETRHAAFLSRTTIAETMSFDRVLVIDEGRVVEDAILVSWH